MLLPIYILSLFLCLPLLIRYSLFSHSSIPRLPVFLSCSAFLLSGPYILHATGTVQSWPLLHFFTIISVVGILQLCFLSRLNSSMYFLAPAFSFSHLDCAISLYIPAQTGYTRKPQQTRTLSSLIRALLYYECLGTLCAAFIVLLSNANFTLVTAPFLSHCLLIIRYLLIDFCFLILLHAGVQSILNHLIPYLVVQLQHRFIASHTGLYLALRSNWFSDQAPLSSIDQLAQFWRHWNLLFHSIFQSVFSLHRRSNIHTKPSKQHIQSPIATLNMIWIFFLSGWIHEYQSFVWFQRLPIFSLHSTLEMFLYGSHAVSVHSVASNSHYSMLIYFCLQPLGLWLERRWFTRRTGKINRLNQLFLFSWLLLMGRFFLCGLGISALQMAQLRFHSMYAVTSKFYSLIVAG